ncbi:IS6 family transposase [Pseudoruegeria sp. SK021]|nr:IS6 family transposase [Pseudoruegeria sp. SK021]
MKSKVPDVPQWAIITNGVPDRVVIDKSGANLAGLQRINVILKSTGTGKISKALQVKDPNTIVEHDHRFIKRETGPLQGFKAFHSAAATIAGIETAHMIWKEQFGSNGLTGTPQFAALAA